MTPRHYQRAAIDSLYSYWGEHSGNPLIVAPCGAGKSLIIAFFIREIVERWGNTRVLVLTHRKELLEQNEAELRGIWPDAPTGFYSAGIGKKDRHADILFAGIQSVYKKIHTMDPFEIVIIDECHLIPRKAGTQYGEAIKYLRLVNPHVKFVGLTATPFRLDSGVLHEGDGALFDAITYDIPVKQLIDEGHLCEVVGKRGAQVADMASVHRRGGEYIQREMEAAMDVPALTRSACAEIVKYGADRRAWLIFAAGIQHAEHIKTALATHGIDAVTITGQTANGEREDIIRRYKSGDIKCLINVDVLTIGFNAPICDMGVLLRATASTALYIQIVGRLMRTYDGKQNALLLDYGGNVERHGPIDNVRVKRPAGDGSGDAPAKACPECHSLVHASALECPDCGHLFPERKPRHESSAYTGAVMSHQIKGDWADVDRVTYSRHRKPGKPDSVRVTYHCGLRTYSDWWMPEHIGFPRTKTIRTLAAIGVQCPATAAELLAMADEIQQPRRIYVKPDGKYIRVERTDYRSKETTTAPAMA